MLEWELLDPMLAVAFPVRILDEDSPARCSQYSSE